LQNPTIHCSRSRAFAQSAPAELLGVVFCHSNALNLCVASFFAPFFQAANGVRKPAFSTAPVLPFFASFSLSFRTCT
jgi:hypothetical protein